MGNYLPKYKRKLKLTVRYVYKPFKSELSLQYLLGRNEIVVHGGLAAPRKRDRERELQGDTSAHRSGALPKEKLLS